MADGAMSRTVIALRVRGMIADRFGVKLNAIGELVALERVLPPSALPMLFTLLRERFGIEFAPDTRLVNERTTVGQLIDLVEGAVREAARQEA